MALCYPCAHGGTTTSMLYTFLSLSWIVSGHLPLLQPLRLCSQLWTEPNLSLHRPGFACDPSGCCPPGPGSLHCPQLRSLRPALLPARLVQRSLANRNPVPRGSTWLGTNAKESSNWGLAMLRKLGQHNCKSLRYQASGKGFAKSSKMQNCNCNFLSASTVWESAGVPSPTQRLARCEQLTQKASHGQLR